MIIRHPAAVDEPTERFLAAVGGYVRQVRQGEWDLMNGIVQGNRHGANFGQHAVHHRHKLVVEMPTPAVVADQHAVAVQQVLPQGFDVVIPQGDVPLAGHIDERRRLIGGEVGQQRNGAELRLGGRGGFDTGAAKSPYCSSMFSSPPMPRFLLSQSPPSYCKRMKRIFPLAVPPPKPPPKPRDSRRNRRAR